MLAHSEAAAPLRRCARGARRAGRRGGRRPSAPPPSRALAAATRRRGRHRGGPPPLPRARLPRAGAAATADARRTRGARLRRVPPLRRARPRGDRAAGGGARGPARTPTAPRAPASRRGWPCGWTPRRPAPGARRSSRRRRRWRGGSATATRSPRRSTHPCWSTGDRERSARALRGGRGDPRARAARRARTTRSCWARMARFVDALELGRAAAVEAELTGLRGGRAGEPPHLRRAGACALLRATGATFSGRLAEGRRSSDAAVALARAGAEDAEQEYAVQRLVLASCAGGRRTRVPARSPPTRRATASCPIWRRCSRPRPGTWAAPAEAPEAIDGIDRDGFAGWPRRRTGWRAAPCSRSPSPAWATAMTRSACGAAGARRRPQRRDRPRLGGDWGRSRGRSGSSPRRSGAADECRQRFRDAAALAGSWGAPAWELRALWDRLAAGLADARAHALAGARARARGRARAAVGRRAAARGSSEDDAVGLLHPAVEPVRRGDDVAGAAPVRAPGVADDEAVGVVADERAGVQDGLMAWPNRLSGPSPATNAAVEPRGQQHRSVLIEPLPPASRARPGRRRRAL